MEAFRNHSRLDGTQRLRWYPYEWAKSRGCDEIIDNEALQSGRGYMDESTGIKRWEISRQKAVRWAYHLPLYKELVASVKPNYVVELGCGAGMGTCAVVDTLNDDQVFFPIDIDFACTANCIGIRKVVRKEEAVLPIVANFWELPFKNKSVDLVCSHYGIDETREVTPVLSEAFRILTPGGPCITVSRNDPTLRMKTYLGDLDFTDLELSEMAQSVDLYSGPDKFIKIAEQIGFETKDAISIACKGTHDRTIFWFEKPKE